MQIIFYLAEPQRRQLMLQKSEDEKRIFQIPLKENQAKSTRASSSYRDWSVT